MFISGKDQPKHTIFKIRLPFILACFSIVKAYNTENQNGKKQLTSQQSTEIGIQKSDQVFIELHQ